MNVIECSGLTKVYGNIKALNDLSVNIEENKITGLVGRNGTGKTTFLKIIAGFLSQSAGEINVFSEKPFNSIKVSANMIFIDDIMTFPPSLTVNDILDAAGGFYANFDLELAKDLLNYFGIDPRQYPIRLSKGMKSTFMVVLGISARCSLTILDEPTIGMDAAVRKDFYRALLKDYVAFPRTIIISSHYLKEIEDLIEDVLLIKDGQKCLHLPITELSELAVGFRGKPDIVEKFVSGKEIIHQERIGKDGLYVVVKNDFTGEKLHKAKMSGLEISGATPEDLCVYLTAKAKGGIDDVFDRD
ncbi:MAG: ABC transporter ATP-binding protein [Dehalobacterium sp.]